MARTPHAFRLLPSTAALFVALGSNVALAQDAAPTGRAEDPKGRPVVCSQALLIEDEVIVACADDGSFVLPSADPGDTLVVFADGYRDSWTVLPDPMPEGGLRVVLRRGRTRRSVSTTRVGGWRPLPRREPAVDDAPHPGRFTITPSDHAGSAGGYGDLNRTLHAVPGVSGDTAASARFRIRGGEPGETLTFIDGIRVDDPTHLGGLFGAFDPDLLDSVRVETGAGSVTDPDALAGSVHVQSIEGPRDRFDGVVDLSFLGAGANVAVDLGKEGADRGASLVLGVRRSLLQAYLAAFEAAGAVDIPLRTVDFGSAFGRLVVRPGPASRITFTLLHLHDRALFDDVNLRHRMWGGALRWHLAPGPRTNLLVHLGWGTEDQGEPPVDFDYPGKRTWNRVTSRGRLLLRAEQGFGPDHVLRVGLDGGPVLQRTVGERYDPAGLPAWVALPQADLLRPLESVDRRADHGELALYGEVELRDLGPVTLLAGARVGLLGASLTPWVSPRLAATLTPRPGTTVRTSVGLSHQDRTDPLLEVASPLPQRALTGTLGIGQSLGPAGVLDVMGWGRAMDHLLVPADGALESTGTGVAAGLDTQWSWRLGRFEARAAWSLLFARRRAPDADAVAPPGDQRHDVEVAGRVYLGRARNFVVGLGYSGASGPPSSTLEPVPVDDDTWAWTIAGVNDRRLAPVHRVDLRLEHRIPTRLVRLRASFELNADLGGRVFLENCPAESADGPPTCQALTFWPPVRPWLGLKAEW